MDTQEQFGDTQEQLASTVRSARRRLWAADAACYYAQRRFSQTENPRDRLLWEKYQKESQEAVAAVRAAEKALAKLKLEMRPDVKPPAVRTASLNVIEEDNLTNPYRPTSRDGKSRADLDGEYR